MDSEAIYNIYCTCGSTSLSLFSDIIIPLIFEILAAFFGVFGAIWLSRKDAREKRKELVRSLRKELETIKTELDERLLYMGTSDYYRYPTQTWDINTRSGALDGLSLNDYKIYIDIYSKIEFAHEIEREWFHSSLIVDKAGDAGSDQKGYLDALNEKRWELASEIDKEIGALLDCDLQK